MIGKKIFTMANFLAEGLFREIFLQILGGRIVFLLFLEWRKPCHRCSPPGLRCQLRVCKPGVANDQ